MQEPHELHWKATKRILIYVKGTSSFGIFYAAGCPLSLIGYTDSDWDGNGTEHKSTSSYVFSFGSGPIFQSRKKQSTITLSTAKAEYRVAVTSECNYTVCLVAGASLRAWYLVSTAGYHIL